MGYLNRLLEKSINLDGTKTLGLYEVQTQHGNCIEVYNIYKNTRKEKKHLFNIVIYSEKVVIEFTNNASGKEIVEVHTNIQEMFDCCEITLQIMEV